MDILDKGGFWNTASTSRVIGQSSDYNLNASLFTPSPYPLHHTRIQGEQCRNEEMNASQIRQRRPFSYPVITVHVTKTAEGVQSQVCSVTHSY